MKTLDRVIIRDIACLSKDIIDYKIDKKKSLTEIFKDFREILKRHNIEKDTLVFNETGEQIGRQGNNSEYTMAMSLFLRRIYSFCEWEFAFYGDITQEEE